MASANVLFWSWIIGVPVSGLVTLICENRNLYVDWNMYRVAVVLVHGFAGGLLSVLFFVANNITSSLLVQLASSLHLVFMLTGQYTVLVNIQVRIQDLVKGGAPASEAESCRHSEAESRERSEHSAAGVQGPLKGPGSFWVFDTQICILTHSRDSFSLIFDIYFDTKS